jgi:hypothetical protein
VNAPIEKRLWSSIARNFITGSQEEQLIVEIQSREAIGELTRLRNENAALEKLIIKEGYIITNFNGELALCRDPWHDRRKEQP